MADGFPHVFYPDASLKLLPLNHLILVELNVQCGGPNLQYCFSEQSSCQ